MNFRSILQLLSVAAFVSIAPSALCAQNNMKFSKQALFDVEGFVATKNLESREGRLFKRHLVCVGIEELGRLEYLRSKGLLSEKGVVEFAQLSELLEPIQNPRKMKPVEFEAFFASLDNAIAVYSTLGQERISGIVAVDIQKQVDSIRKSTQSNSFTPDSTLTLEAIQDVIGFSDDQREKFNRQVKHSTSEIFYGNREAFQALEELIRQHWKSLLDVLEPQQAEKARRSIGTPLCWFKCRNKATYSRFVPTNGTHVIIHSDVGVKKSPDGRPLHQLSPKELEELGVDFIYVHCTRILESRFVHDELEILSEQRASISTDMRTTLSIFGYHEDRLVALVEQDEIGYPTFLKEELLEHQLLRLRQLEFQFLTMEFASSVGLLHPDVLDLMDLSSKQVKQIGNLARDYEAESRRLFEQIQKGRKEAQRKFDSEVGKLLTEEQQNRLHSWRYGRNRKKASVK